MHTKSISMVDTIAMFLDPEEREVMQSLVGYQDALLSEWQAISDPVIKAKLPKQLVKINREYPGGLVEYTTKGRRILADYRAEKNPLEGAIPHVPVGAALTNIKNVYKYEEAGLKLIEHTGFVLVAGGLGKRLGWDGTKLAIGIESLQNTMYIKHYISSILAFQTRAMELLGRRVECPLAIMLSEDNIDLVKKLFESNNYFGMHKYNISFLVQGKVPAFKNNQADFVFKSDTGEIVADPAGHGAVHLLMLQEDVLEKWKARGIKHMLTFQDTNAQAFNVIPALLGYSAAEKFDMNSMAVPRNAGEKVGALVGVEHPDGTLLTINVEYVILNAFLKSSKEFSKGDIADPQTGLSPFPGNTNIIYNNFDTYARVLEATNGLVPEMVNPKEYTDTEKTHFHTQPRLETNYQDIARSFKNSKVGYTTFDRGYCFSAAKNKIIDAAKAQANGKSAESASTAEAHYFAANRNKFKFADMEMEAGLDKTYQDIIVNVGAKIIASPRYLLISDIRKRVQGGKMTARSALVLNGENIVLANLDLDGALVVNAHPEAYVTLKDLKIINDSWDYEELSDEEMEDPKVPQIEKIRGYKLIKKAQKIINIDKPGKYVVTQDAQTGEIRIN